MSVQGSVLLRVVVGFTCSIIYLHGGNITSTHFVTCPQKSLQLRWIRHRFIASASVKGDAISDARHLYRPIFPNALAPPDAAKQKRHGRVMEGSIIATGRTPAAVAAGKKSKWKAECKRQSRQQGHMLWHHTAIRMDRVGSPRRSISMSH